RVVLRLAQAVAQQQPQGRGEAGQAAHSFTFAERSCAQLTTLGTARIAGSATFHFTFVTGEPMLKLTTCLGALALAACASQPAAVAVPANLVPAGERAIERLGARGVQIYECRNKVGGSGTEWVFVAPEADLFDV